MYRVRLTSDGYYVVVGRDGEEGVRLAVSEAPDCIYLDLRLPKLDGFEVNGALARHADHGADSCHHPEQLR
jgi:DNA-binding response OmpR family regulator